MSQKMNELSTKGLGARRKMRSDALAVGIWRKRVNWMLDGTSATAFPAWNIRGFERLIEHRIAEERVLQHARGDVIVVRFADDLVAGFEHQGDAQRFRADLRERFAKFALELNTEKTPPEPTRLRRAGRPAPPAARRRAAAR